MNNILRKILFVLALSVFLFSAWRVGSTLYQYRQIEITYEGLADQVVTTQEAYQPIRSMVAVEETEKISDIELYKEEYGTPPDIDWEELNEMNPDIVGWVWIPWVKVNYPILYHETKDYYLRLTHLKEWNIAGSIFIDYKNSPDFDDFNTIIYGHNMKNDTMFGLMGYFLEDEEAKDHPYAWILTPEADYVYEIYSSYVDTPIGDAYLLYDRDYDHKEVSDWIDAMYARRLIDHPKPHITQDDHIMTFSSCPPYDWDRWRRISQGVRVYVNWKISLEERIDRGLHMPNDLDLRDAH